MYRGAHLRLYWFAGRPRQRIARVTLVLDGV